MDDAARWITIIVSVIGIGVVMINSATVFVLSSISRRLERLENFVFTMAQFTEKERRSHAR